MTARKTLSTAIELAGLSSILAGVAILAGLAWALISAGVVAVLYAAYLDR